MYVPQQIERWNRLTRSVIKQEHRKGRTKHLLIDQPSRRTPNPVVFKQIHHLPERFVNNPYGAPAIRKKTQLGRRKKNWLRRIKMRNMQKKQLPPLPPGTPGGPRIFYKNTYNINLFDCKIRRRFDVSSIPQYDYGYDRALQLFKNYKSKPAVVIEDVTNRATTNTRFVIFKQDQAIINDPNVFLRRTSPPDDKSISTISDNSYVSAAETVATIDYPPTPAREHQLKELFLTTLDLYYEHSVLDSIYVQHQVMMKEKYG